MPDKELEKSFKYYDYFYYNHKLLKGLNFHLLLATISLKLSLK